MPPFMFRRCRYPTKRTDSDAVPVRTISRAEQHYNFYWCRWRAAAMVGRGSDTVRRQRPAGAGGDAARGWLDVDAIKQLRFRSGVAYNYDDFSKGKRNHVNTATTRLLKP